MLLLVRVCHPEYITPRFDVYGSLIELTTLDATCCIPRGWNLVIGPCNLVGKLRLGLYGGSGDLA